MTSPAPRAHESAPWAGASSLAADVLVFTGGPGGLARRVCLAYVTCDLAVCDEPTHGDGECVTFIPE